ncbi:hypothetical protein EPA93_24880 [Ktedonosporobacter rubrisoli]|uniref:Zinc ribbon domain-containing protein n=1 Tax=Ktedonosporobacter rubrisoli TaxID=2509675 RepID=A0A4P6JUM7_KTERU|nr:hypothetical protein [Ktedonosporobacter rubrisoli]QBD79043.1 hypothetical protein EPA93_24880 [Ktedonosporobacter rubrisoli]
MNCNSCGAPLQTGLAYCNSCGSPTPYNTGGQGAHSSPYDPTIAVSPYEAGQNPPSTPSSAPSYSYDPTQLASSPYNSGSPQPSTSYGAQSPYGYGNQAQGANSYSAPPPPAYGATDPYASSNPYAGTGAANSAQAPSGYGYGAPPVPPSPVQPGTYGIPQPPAKRKGNTALIVGIVVVVLVLGICGGLYAIGSSLTKNNTTASTNTPTATTHAATPATVSEVPPDSAVIPSASSMIFHPKTSKGINQTDFSPITVTSNFNAGDKVYVIFDIDTKGQDGYVLAKWYQNGKRIDSYILKHSHTSDVAYFMEKYDTTGQSAVALFWCMQSSCTDAQLADVVQFNVQGTTSLNPTTPAVDLAALYTQRRTL